MQVEHDMDGSCYTRVGGALAAQVRPHANEEHMRAITQFAEEE